MLRPVCTLHHHALAEKREHVAAFPATATPPPQLGDQGYGSGGGHFWGLFFSLDRAHPRE